MENSRWYPVPIEELLTKPKVLVDLYVRLSDSKYVMVAKAGTNTSHEHLQKFKDKGLIYLFVRPEDFMALVRQSISIAGMTVGNKALNNLGKLTVIEEALGSVFHEVTRIGVNEQVVQHARVVSEATLSVVSAFPPLTDLVNRFSSLNSDLPRHAMLVSMVSVMIGIGHEWVKQSTRERLALGGLLHDIGKVVMPADLIGKPASRLSVDEMVIFKSHPELGRQLLAGVKGLPDDVALIVFEHHEASDGSGFPRGIKDFQISPLARVVALANEFAEQVLAEGEELSERSARRALESIEYNRSQKFNRDSLKVLRRLIEGEAMKKVG